MILMVYNSKDLKVVVGVESSLQGSRRSNAVPPPMMELVHESRLIDCFTVHQHRKAISDKKRC